MYLLTEFSSLSALAGRRAELERARLVVVSYYGAVCRGCYGSYAACHCGRGAHLTRESAPPKRARDIVVDCTLSHSVAGTFMKLPQNKSTADYGGRGEARNQRNPSALTIFPCLHFGSIPPQPIKIAEMDNLSTVIG